jgi:hypothetical protein
MTCSLRALVTLAASITFLSCAPTEDAPDIPAPLASEFACPPPGTLNCMPIVSRARRAYCSADYRDWITSHCPDVAIVY